MDSLKDSSMKKVKQNKIHWIVNETWRKNKQMFPDFSGKYHGKLNDKISRKSAVKISIKCNCRKKVITEKSSEFQGKA